MKTQVGERARRLFGGVKARLKEMAGLGASPRQIKKVAVPQGQVSAGRVLLIGPALDTIPPIGWGAVELVLDEQSRAIANGGFEVCVLNSGALADWVRVRPWKYNVAIVHFERWLPRTYLMRTLFRIPVVACSHYAYFQWPDKWNRGYKSWFRQLVKADGFVALSQEMANLYRENSPPGTAITVAPNGSDFKPQEGVFYSNRVLVLGRVERRKRQYEVFEALKDSPFAVTIAGPIADDRVTRLLKMSPKAEATFVGPWSRTDVTTRITEFSVLILASDGEADALVLYEAQLAGLAVVVTESSVGSLDVTLPWVHLVRDDLSDLIEQVQSAQLAAASQRPEIRKFSESHYRWESRITPLLSLISTYTDIQ